MKQHVVTLLTFCLLLATACTSGSRMRQQLADLQARNAADSLLTNDSLAHVLCDYFDSHGTPNERMLAHYLMGRTYADLEQSPQALDEFHRAAEQADTTAADCDYSLLARIHAQTANLFYYQSLYRNQLEELAQTERYAWMGHDTVIAINVLNEQAHAYRQMNMLDSAYILTKDAVRQFRQAGYQRYAAVSEGLLVPIQVELGLFDEAKAGMDTYELSSGLFTSSGDIEQGREIYYYYKGLYYLSQDNTDSAEVLFRKELREASDLNNQTAGSRGLMLLYKARHQPDSTAKYAEIAYALNDSSVNKLESEKILQLHSLYKYERGWHVAGQKAIEAAHAQKIAGLLFLVVIFLLLAAYFVYVRMQRKQDALFQKYCMDREKQRQLQQMVDMMEVETGRHHLLIAQMKDEISSLNSSIAEYKSQNESRASAYIERALQDSEIVKRFHTFEKPPFHHPTEEEWNVLYSLVEHEIPSFHATLRTSDHPLSDTEYRICVLTRLHFSPSAISLLLEKDLSNVSKIRQRLLTKVFMVSGGAKDFDKRILRIL